MPAYATRERLDLLREADHIVMSALRAHGLYHEIWQCPTVLVPLDLDGTGGELVVLRPVQSRRAMTAQPVQLPEPILNELRHDLLALPGVTMDAMPAASGGRSAKLDDDTQAEVEARQTGGPWQMAAGLTYDDVIDPRELRNALQFVYVKCQSGILAPHHLPKEILNLKVRHTSRPGPAAKLDQEQVLAAMGEARGNKSKAARILGVGRSTLYRFLTQQGLAPE